MFFMQLLIRLQAFCRWFCAFLCKYQDNLLFSQSIVIMYYYIDYFYFLSFLKNRYSGHFVFPHGYINILKQMPVFFKDLNKTDSDCFIFWQIFKFLFRCMKQQQKLYFVYQKWVDRENLFSPFQYSFLSLLSLLYIICFCSYRLDTIKNNNNNNNI